MSSSHKKTPAWGEQEGVCLTGGAGALLSLTAAARCLQQRLRVVVAATHPGIGPWKHLKANWTNRNPLAPI